MSTYTLIAVAFAALAACGGGGSSLDLDNRDPRCVTVCQPEVPPIEGVGAICNTASFAACLDECEARIAGLETLCATCLVEEACLSMGSSCGGDEGGGDECSDTTCTTTGPNGSCTYPQGNTAARDACRRQVDPRREVSCTAKFRPTAECASSCVGG